jgi:hypothetical protein
MCQFGTKRLERESRSTCGCCTQASTPVAQPHSQPRCCSRGGVCTLTAQDKMERHFFVVTRTTCQPFKLPPRVDAGLELDLLFVPGCPPNAPDMVVDPNGRAAQPTHAF